MQVQDEICPSIQGTVDMDYEQLDNSPINSIESGVAKLVRKLYPKGN